MNRYLEGGREDRECGERIEPLKAFLGSTDFGKLRSQSEKHLIEGKKVKSVICGQEGGLDYRMMVIEPV